MKYIFDIDAFKKCLELYASTIDADGNDVIEIEVVKRLLDAFPKEEVRNANAVTLRGGSYGIR